MRETGISGLSFSRGKETFIVLKKEKENNKMVFVKDGDSPVHKRWFVLNGIYNVATLTQRRQEKRYIHVHLKVLFLLTTWHISARIMFSRQWFFWSWKYWSPWSFYIVHNTCKYDIWFFVLLSLCCRFSDVICFYLLISSGVSIFFVHFQHSQCSVFIIKCMFLKNSIRIFEYISVPSYNYTVTNNTSNG